MSTSETDLCACHPHPPGDPNDPEKPRGWLKGVFTAVAGVATTHSGCILSSLVAGGVSLGLGEATSSVVAHPAFAPVFGTVLTVGGLGVWAKYKWKEACATTKRWVIGGAVGGIVLTTAFNLFAHNHSPAPEEYCPSGTGKCCNRPVNPDLSK